MAPLSQPVDDGDFTAETTGHDARSGQPQPVTSELGARVVRHPGVAFENHLAVLGLDARPIVGDFQHNDTFLGIDGHPNVNVFFAVVKGIFKQVADNLSELDLVLVDLGVGRRGGYLQG